MSDEQCVTLEWPELVGEPRKKAAAVIEKEKSLGDVVPIPRGRLMTYDCSCKRVWLFVNKDLLQFCWIWFGCINSN
ncbi:hypothetical protein NMG60_11023255 [Bertholletia excelsa]